MVAFQNNCETHPVVFEKLIADDLKAAKDFRAYRGSNTWSADGFAVRSRVKPRVGIDGTSTKQITSFTIDKKQEVDNILEELSVEEILQKRLQVNDQSRGRRREDLGIPNLTNLSHHKRDKRKKSHTPPCSARSGKDELVSQPPSRMGVGSGLGFTSGDSRSVRPLTAHSANNIDQNFDSFVVTSAASGCLKPTSARSGGRATSGKRPPPAKPSLHKSAAAMGASISSSASKGDTEYIKITHSLSPPSKDIETEESPGEDQGIPPPTPNSGDLSMAGDDAYDQELSQDGFSDFDSDLEDAVREAEADNGGVHDFVEIQVAPPSISVTEPPPLPEEIPEEVEVRTVEQSGEADVRYAFDIPTADEVDEEEVDDGNDKPSLHDRLVEQTAELLAGAIIGADLPDQFGELTPDSKQSRSESRQSRARSITFDDEGGHS